MHNKILKLAGLAVASLLVPLCSACNYESGSGKLKIVTSIYPEYDWVMNILGEKKDNAKVTMLLDSGSDLHSYQPTPKDIKNIAKCDLLVFVGGESDEWVDDALKQAINKNMKTINLLETLGDGAKEEDEEGAEEDEHDHDHDDDDDDHEGHEHHHEEGEVEYDEHVWLSLKNAKLFVKTIGDTLGQIDSENASYYKSNADTYIASLNALDERYQAAVDAKVKDTLLFADRYPFRYLLDDYGLNHVAAFSGCSAENTVGPNTLRMLVDKVNELNLSVIYKIDGSDGKIAESVKESTGKTDLKILTMDSLQSGASTQFSTTNNYLTRMEANLEVIKEGLK